VVQVCLEYVLSAQLLVQRVNQVVVGVKYLAAAAADKMNMLAVLCSGIDYATIPQIDATGQAGGYQQVQRAVDGSDVDGVGAITDLSVDFLCSHVPAGVSQGFNDHLTLRGQAVTALAQGFKKGMAVSHCEFFLLQLLAIILLNRTLKVNDLFKYKGRVICPPR